MGTSLKLRGDILYATAGDVVSLRELISQIIHAAIMLMAARTAGRKLVDTANTT